MTTGIFYMGDKAIYQDKPSQELIRLMKVCKHGVTREIIGYKLNGVAERKDVDRLLNYSMPHYGDILLSGRSVNVIQMTEEEKSVYFTTGHVGGSLVQRLRELKVLDIWFEPIYKKQ